MYCSTEFDCLKSCTCWHWKNGVPITFEQHTHEVDQFPYITFQHYFDGLLTVFDFSKWFLGSTVGSCTNIYVAHPVKAMGKSSKKNEKKGKSRKDKKAKKQSSSSSSSAEVAEDPEDRKNTLAVASSFGVIPGFPNWP